MRAAPNSLPLLLWLLSQQRDRSEQRDPAEDIDGSSFSLRDGGPRDVTLTLPNGQRTTFSFSLQRATGAEAGGLDPQFVYVVTAQRIVMRSKSGCAAKFLNFRLTA